MIETVSENMNTLVDEQSVNIDVLIDHTFKLEKYFYQMAGPRANEMNWYFVSLQALLNSSKVSNQIVEQRKPIPIPSFSEYALQNTDDEEMNFILRDIIAYQSSKVRKFVSQQHEQGGEHWKNFIEYVTGNPIGPLAGTVYKNTLSNFIIGECDKHQIFKSEQHEYTIERMRRYRELKKK